MYCYFFLDSQLNRLIQNIKNTALSKHFTKPAEYTSILACGTIFIADVWISDGQVIFQYKPGA